MSAIVIQQMAPSTITIGGGPVGGAPPPFDPATLNLSLWIDASKEGYDDGAGTWASNASAGTSGDYVLTVPGGFGTPTLFDLDGFTAASFASAEALTIAGETGSAFFSSTGATIAVLAYITSIAADAPPGQDYNNDAIVIGSSSDFGLTAFSGGPGIGAFTFDSGASEFVDARSDVAVGSWQFLFMAWDTANIYSSVNGGVVASSTLVTPTFAGDEVLIGSSETMPFTGNIAAIFFSPTALTTMQRDQLRSYCAAEFGVSV